MSAEPPVPPSPPPGSPRRESPRESPTETLRDRLGELVRLFGRLGIVGFGGPQAHIAMMNDEVVVRRGWLSADDIAEGIALCEMLPGPASTQLGIYIGYRRAGWWGAIAAGLAFIAPAFAIVLLLSWAYFQFQAVPQVQNLFLGISPVVTAIVLAFCWKLGKRAVTDGIRAAIAAIALAVTLATSVSVLLQFLVGGAIGALVYGPRQARRSTARERSAIARTAAEGEAPAATRGDRPEGGSRSDSGGSSPALLGGLGLELAAHWGPLAATAPAEVLALSGFWGLDRIGDYFGPLVWFFLRAGTLIFGGGLTIVPLLEFEVVDRLGWLTQEEFINGVAIGQLSPGPVVLTSAFVGFKVAGVLGALVAAAAIFAPSFAFIGLAAPALQRLRQNPWVRGFLQGVTPAVLGAIAAAALLLIRALLVQTTPLRAIAALAVLAAALVGLLRFKVPTWQLVPAGAIAGLAIGGLL